MIHQIIYSSEASTPMQTEHLEEILSRARKNNASAGITGALVYADGIFLQILEGERAALEKLMAKILRDVRHERVVVLREGEVPSAKFGSWKMAYVSATRQQIAKWAGLGAATDTTESLGETDEDKRQTAQFAEDILALLISDGAATTKDG